MPWPRALPALLAALPFAVAGCGDGDVFATDRPALRVQLDEYRINPQEIRVQRQARLKVVATNTGRLTHNWVLQTPAANAGERPEDVEGARIPTLQPGETGSTKIDGAHLPPGEYTMICTIANHDDLGQFGRLIVEE